MFPRATYDTNRMNLKAVLKRSGVDKVIAKMLWELITSPPTLHNFLQFELCVEFTDELETKNHNGDTPVIHALKNSESDKIVRFLLSNTKTAINQVPF